MQSNLVSAMQCIKMQSAIFIDHTYEYCNMHTYVSAAAYVYAVAHN